MGIPTCGNPVGILWEFPQKSCGNGMGMGMKIHFHGNPGKLSLIRTPGDSRNLFALSGIRITGVTCMHLYRLWELNLVLLIRVRINENTVH